MSIKAYEKIQVVLKNGTTADDLYLDAFLAKSNTERTHPMHEWFTIDILQASPAENATGANPKTKQTKASLQTMSGMMNATYVDSDDDFILVTPQSTVVVSDDDPIRSPPMSEAFRLIETPVDVRHGVYSSVFANGDLNNRLEALPDLLRKEVLPKSLQKDECLNYLNIHINAFDLERRDGWLKNGGISSRVAFEPTQSKLLVPHILPEGERKKNQKRSRNEEEKRLRNEIRNEILNEIRDLTNEVHGFAQRTLGIK
ncbi:hypothetical protein PG996_007521 [Apiospora saccharicola]|uniref:Uncharacterized protein n=1 Tax=Apiospora saccharicola TaxID=335842 RepID=A0ABR1VB21_9PEZI